MSKHEEILDDPLLNMSMDEAIPDYVSVPHRTLPRKSKEGGNIEVKKYGVTVDMVATIEQAKAIAHGGDYEVFAHDGHTKRIISPRAFSHIPGNKPRQRKE